MSKVHPVGLAVLLALLGASFAGCAGRNSTRKSAMSPTTAPSGDGKDHSAEHARYVYKPDEIVSVLDNGMVVICKRVPTPVLAVRAYVRAGGIFEGKWLGGGLSHLLEHLVAGGSNERRTEEQNRNLLQQIGNNSNAYTTSDHTAYFVNTTPEHLDKAVDLIAGWMLGAKITRDEYAREYEVVQRELEKDKGEPDWVFYYLTVSNRYMVSPARVPVIGYQEVIQGLSRDDVYAYYKLAYAPNNMVFSLTGDLDPEVMLKAVQKNVRDAAPGRGFSHDIAEEPPIVAPRTTVATFPKLGQAKLDLGFPTIKLAHEDLYALDLLSTILATGESSILIQELRDKRGLVSAVGSVSNTPVHVDGTFSVSMELDHDKIAAATEAALELLEQVKTQGVSEDRLARAKTQMKTARAFGLQSSEDVAASLATDYISTGDAHFSDHYVDRIQKVTAEQVQGVARKYFDRSKLLTTAMVPEEVVATAGLPAAANLLRPLSPTTQQWPAQPKSEVVRVELGDGTILLLKRVATSPVVAISMYSLGGLTAEDAKSNGLGNLAMMSLSRGTTSRSAQEIASFWDSIGGRFSAVSGNNSWNWSATCLKDDLPRALEVFGDIVKNPSFPESELAILKRRIQAAIDAQDADWLQQSMRYFRKQYFGPQNSPYQFLPIGTKDNVAEFSREQVQQWYAEKVRKGRRVLGIYGDIDIEQAKKLAEEQFGAARQGNTGGPRISGGSASMGGHLSAKASVNIQRVEIQRTNNPQAGVVIGFNARPVVGEDVTFPLTVADTLASGFGYPTGYIFEILRGRGLIYDSHAYLMPGRSPEIPGTFLIYAGCDPKNVNEVTDVILENIARLQGTAEEIKSDWFERGKQLIITSDALQTETAAEQLQTAALDELFGLGFNFHDQFDERINAVTLDDLRRTARERLVECVVTVNTASPDAVSIRPGTRTYDSFPPVDLTPKGVEHAPAGAR